MNNVNTINSATIPSLPSEMWQHIMVLGDLRDAFALRLVTQSMNQVFNNRWTWQQRSIRLSYRNPAATINGLEQFLKRKSYPTTPTISVQHFRAMCEQRDHCLQSHDRLSYNVGMEVYMQLYHSFMCGGEVAPRRMYLDADQTSKRYHWFSALGYYGNSEAINVWLASLREHHRRTNCISRSIRPSSSHSTDMPQATLINMDSEKRPVLGIRDVDVVVSAAISAGHTHVINLIVGHIAELEKPKLTTTYTPIRYPSPFSPSNTYSQGSGSFFSTGSHLLMEPSGGLNNMYARQTSELPPHIDDDPLTVIPRPSLGSIWGQRSALSRGVPPLPRINRRYHSRRSNGYRKYHLRDKLQSNGGRG